MRFALLAVMITASAHAADWRTYAGGFTTSWQTQGHHGHDQQPCGNPVTCNPIDFTRANLDNSIGFRFGRERDLFEFGPMSIVGGTDASISHTE